ncbi:armadillo repeat-containing protein 8-like [Acanthaster planci]|uniref:Armadillo repeat-containing protein 8 n=1 Tax=Acanthaster planci TaxID=133434 RepID=A0A8B7ZWE6_ACAPL|nr:armadillo repeat-containing protein 8-like [Acanthaster planci]
MYEFAMMDTGLGQLYVDSLNVSDTQQLLCNLKQMKNVVIGSNRQKANLMLCGAVPRLLSVITSEKSPAVLVECAIILGSFAKGSEETKKRLLAEGVLTIMLQGLAHSDLKFVEACLRFLRTMMTSPTAPTDILHQDSTIIPHLIQLLPQSKCTQECIAGILATCCKNSEHQETLFRHGAVGALAPLLDINEDRIQLPTLRCYAALAYQNRNVSSAIASSMHNGECLLEIFCRLLSRNHSVAMQLTAAKCLSYLCRAGAVAVDNPIIQFRVLPCLVRMCKKDRSVEERVEGAETLAFLIEEDIELQRVASITDHLILTLAGFLRYIPEATNKNEDLSTEMKQAAFKVFASLGTNEEDIRKKIIDTESLMDQIEKCLSEPNLKVQLSAVRCLHSLSRSVQQLRTSFQDHAVWKPLMKLLRLGHPDELMTIASSTLCNLLLEFSPSKEPIVEAGAVELLCKLTASQNTALRLNGIWGLMNMAFQAEQKIKNSILGSLGTDQLFDLLTDSNVDILMKTLGLLRNLLSTKQHIDSIMMSHNKQIMTAVIMILEGDHPPDVKEQTLCILANIADGHSAKEYIMSNEDILKKLTYYMRIEHVKLQIAAVYCINNLVWTEEDGAAERQAKLKEYGIQKHLQTLLDSNDTVLFDKVKTALQQFSS